MTSVDVSFRYGSTPDETGMQALGSVREVYGIRAIKFDEKTRVVRVEFDATRLNEKNVENLLRRAGLDLTEKLQMV